MMTLGNTLKRLREQKGVTQEQLSQELGFKSKQVIYSYEKDINEPSIEIIKKLADFFEISIDQLLGRQAQDKINIASEPSDHYKSSRRLQSNFLIDQNDTDKEIRTQASIMSTEHFALFEKHIEEKMYWKIKYEECIKNKSGN